VREIKFRGKRVDTGGWIYGSLSIQHDECGSKVFLITEIRNDCRNLTISGYGNYSPYGNFGKYLYVDGNTIGQFTGLTDKNGKEIYEGDIVYSSETNYATGEDIGRGQIVYDDGFVGFVIWIYGNTYLQSPNGDYIEVIGNIHDNLELLNGGN
jgi:uncharacterized phage protein (TIGR01671 family)